MLNKFLKKTLLTINIIILLSPFALVAYHVFVFFQTGEIVVIPMLHAFYDWFGIDLTIDSVGKGFEKLYDIYLSLVRLPLLLWLFILAVPSFVKLYRQM